jgi:hypothetical protein
MITENIKNYENILHDVKDHPLCLKYKEDGPYILVIFPDGYFPDGVRVNYSIMGKIKALKIILEKMEKAWKESCIH